MSFLPRSNLKTLPTINSPRLAFQNGSRAECAFSALPSSRPDLSDAYVQHGTCPTCRHEFLPELRPVDSDAESSDEEYVPTEIDADTDMDTDYEDGFMDSDGIDLETMDADDTPYLAGDDEATEGEERESIASSRVHAGYHESHDPEAQSVCGSEAAWWDGSVDGEQEWGLTDGDSMGTSEGELSFGDRQLGMPLFMITCCWTFYLALYTFFWTETNVQVRLDSEGEYTIYEDSTEPKT